MKMDATTDVAVSHMVLAKNAPVNASRDIL
jgi:hypothetical protein